MACVTSQPGKLLLQLMVGAMAQAVQCPRHPQYHDNKNHGDHHQNQKVAWLHLTVFDYGDLAQLASLKSEEIRVTQINIMK